MRPFFPWKQALRSNAVRFSLSVILALTLIAVGAPWLAPHDPYQASILQKRLPPMWVQTISQQGQAEYPLGTDMYGRDILSRLIYGTRTAFSLALAAISVAMLLGTLIGLSAGYFGGWLDSGFTFLIDLLQTLPGIMFLVLSVLILRAKLTPTWGHGLLTLVIGFAVVGWAGLARQVRVNVRLIKSQRYVEAATALGANPAHIIFRHLLPNVLHVIVVWVINNIPMVILLEALLGYIGVGVTSAVDGGEFSVISWGGMFFSGRSALSRNPFMLIVPSLILLLFSMSFFLLGDFLNDLTRSRAE